MVEVVEGGTGGVAAAATEFNYIFNFLKFAVGKLNIIP